MTEFAVKVTAALARSVLPSVIARGAALRVVAVEDGVATLEVTGSPGAVLPLVSRIEAQVHAAVPEVTRVRIAAPGAPLPLPAPDGIAGLAGQAGQVIDTEINPAIAAHRGHITVAGVDGDRIRVRMEGGCQGCALAEVTLRQGVEPLLRAHLPGIAAVVDVTDHEAGTQPHFPPPKR